jgi:hypothetical protein
MGLGRVTGLESTGAGRKQKRLFSVRIIGIFGRDISGFNPKIKAHQTLQQLQSLPESPALPSV